MQTSQWRLHDSNVQYELHTLWYISYNCFTWNWPLIRQTTQEYIIFTCHRQEYQYYDQLETVITFSKVLSVVIVDLAQTPIFFNQVVLSATQVDLTVLQYTTQWVTCTEVQHLTCITSTSWRLTTYLCLDLTQLHTMHRVTDMHSETWFWHQKVSFRHR